MNDTPQRLSPKVKNVLRFLVVLVVLAVAGWFAYYELRGRYREDTNDAYVAADMVVVAPKVGGYVEEVFVSDNQDVAAGQPLVRIDARDYKAQSDIAAASADNLRAVLEEQDATIAQARAQLAAAESEARTDEDEVKRYAPLAASGADTQEKLAALRNRAANSKATLDARRASLQAALRRVDALKAQIRQAQAQFEAASINLDSTVIKASVAGRVGDKSVQTGQFVQPGTRLMSVVPLAGIYVEANFKETQIGRLRAGQPVSIKVDALPSVELKGHVESVAPGTGSQFSLLPPQNATGNFTKIVQRVPVRIALEASAEARRVLVPGLSVTVRVDTYAAKDDLDRIRDQEAGREAGS